VPAVSAYHLTDPPGLVFDVEKVNLRSVTHDFERKIYTVRYKAVSAMLLDEF